MKSREDALSQQSAVTCPASDLSGTCVWTTRGFRRAESRFSSTTRISPRAEATASILSSGESLSRTIDPAFPAATFPVALQPLLRAHRCSKSPATSATGARGAPRRRKRNTPPSECRTQETQRHVERGPLQAPRELQDSRTSTRRRRLSPYRIHPPGPARRISQKWSISGIRPVPIYVVLERISMSCGAT